MLAKLRENTIWQVSPAELRKDDAEIAQVSLAQITWYHHISLLSKVNDISERAFYIIESAKNRWNCDVMLYNDICDIIDNERNKIAIAKEHCCNKHNDKE